MVTIGFIVILVLGALATGKEPTKGTEGRVFSLVIMCMLIDAFIQLLLIYNNYFLGA